MGSLLDMPPPSVSPAVPLSMACCFDGFFFSVLFSGCFVPFFKRVMVGGTERYYVTGISSHSKGNASAYVKPGKLIFAILRLIFLSPLL
jgi:hypothetical protein